MTEASFRSEWLSLFAQCPWATPFQRFEYADAWYTAYLTVQEPVVVTARNPDDRLVGLFAGGRSAQGIVAVGAHQSEYPGWLAAPDVHVAVFDAMLEELDANFGRTALMFRYLPAAFPVADLCRNSRHRSRILTRPYLRPLMDLATASAGDSLKKKGNRNRLNRLKRHGSVQLEVVDDVEGLERVFDVLIAQYDSRQLAINDVSPFASDVNKRTFHIEMMRRGLLHVCVLRVGDNVAAAVLAMRSPAEVSLAIVSFDVEFADESPNKLLLLLLAQRLAGDGFHLLDLTPGGDPWKDLFANRYEEVRELRILRTPGARLLKSADQMARRFVKEVDRRYFRGAVGRIHKRAKGWTGIRIPAFLARR